MTTPHLDRARSERAALGLARQWMAADLYYRERPEPSEREVALMHLALRCLLDPGLVERQLAALPALKETR